MEKVRSLFRWIDNKVQAAERAEVWVKWAALLVAIGGTATAMAMWQRVVDYWGPILVYLVLVGFVVVSGKAAYNTIPRKRNPADITSIGDDWMGRDEAIQALLGSSLVPLPLRAPESIEQATGLLAEFQEERPSACRGHTHVNELALEVWIGRRALRNRGLWPMRGHR